MNRSPILAADIGGTHCRLWLVEIEEGKHAVIRQETYRSGEYPDLLPILRSFLAIDGATPGSACLAIAGPVTERNGGQTAIVTNLPWQLDSDALGHALAIPSVRLINDFAAVAHGISALESKDLVTLQAGTPVTGGTRAVLGAGTGLGQAILPWCGNHYQVLATEGGHIDFAPQTDEQWQMLRALQDRYGHVSYERFVSGAGLTFIYQFLRARHGGDPPGAIADAFANGDPAAAISRMALARTDPVAVRALQEFTAIYGAQAGNLALTCLPLGGLYVAGGIAPKLIDRLSDGSFMAAFNAKGRMQPITRQVPVHVVIHPNPGLLGAALYAVRPH